MAYPMPLFAPVTTPTLANGILMIDGASRMMLSMRSVLLEPMGKGTWPGRKLMGTNAGKEGLRHGFPQRCRFRICNHRAPYLRRAFLSCQVLTLHLHTHRAPQREIQINRSEVRPKANRAMQVTIKQIAIRMRNGRL